MFRFLPMIPSSAEVFEFNSCVAAGEARGTTAKFWAPKTSEKMSELLEAVEGLKRISGGKHAHVTELVSAELTLFRLVIIATFSNSESTVSDVIHSLCDSFPVEAPFGAMGAFVAGSCDQA